jgi:hypothetical protein
MEVLRVVQETSFGGKSLVGARICLFFSLSFIIFIQGHAIDWFNSIFQYHVHVINIVYWDIELLRF